MNTYRFFMLSATCLMLTVNATTHAQAPLDDDAAMIEYLKNLDFGQLQEVEVTLDDTFDIFDGLIKARKVKVASGVEQSMSRAPAVTTVITAQDIEATGANDLDDILESVPGLHVGRDNFYNPIYSVRGLYSITNPEILLLINGIPMRDLVAGNRGTAWGGMPVNNIARIEIIRGPGSAVFGADAFSGVINIITKQAEDIKGTEVGVRAGTYDTYDVWALHGGKFSGFELAAALEIQHTDGPDEIIRADRQSQLDKKTGSNASYAPGSVERSQRTVDARLDLSKGLWRLRTGFQSRSNLGVGAGIGRSLDPRGDVVEIRYNADITYHDPVFTQHWDVSAQISFLDRRFESKNLTLFPPGTRLPFPRQATGVVYEDGVWQSHSMDQRYTRLELDSLYTGLKNHVFRLGAGYAYEDLYKTTYITNRGLGADLKPIPPGAGGVVLDDTPGVIMPEKIRKNAHIFIQDTWALADAWEMTAGVRYDDYSDFGNTINPRFALVWQTSPHLTTKLLYGHAFRAPSFRELYVYNNIYRGNSDLKAETISTWELAFDHRTRDNLHLALNLFRYKIKDKILFVPIPNTAQLQAENKGGQKGYGMELEARWKINNKSSLLFNYAYARSDNDQGEDMGDYPRHTIYLRNDWLLKPKWYLNIQANFVADRQRPPADTRPALDDDITVDLTLRRKDIRAGQWNLATGVRNVFNSDRREPILPDIPDDLPLAGRQFFAEARYHF
ncbi:TonB-dependent receptor [Candidatus Venteria ishoeyi]|uniref:TonB-dependent receptor plug domain-containing protein n=1 Tax=Candidatus Venteria ishoeyi TaxID=1899563 RepID=UPI0025A4F1F0|nr:TonB-dependent receptor [Candidatus Venteria ishoeyi]MDM8547159.1 TonB-dependent receptor [Candidatus Venteria ishoeyi]